MVGEGDSLNVVNPVLSLIAQSLMSSRCLIQQDEGLAVSRSGPRKKAGYLENQIPAPYSNLSSLWQTQRPGKLSSGISDDFICTLLVPTWTGMLKLVGVRPGSLVLPTWCQQPQTSLSGKLRPRVDSRQHHPPSTFNHPVVSLCSYQHQVWAVTPHLSDR